MKLIKMIFLCVVSVVSVGHAAEMTDRVAEQAPVRSVQECYSAALEAFQKEDWKSLIHEASIVTKNYSATPFAHEAHYYLGVGFYHLNDLEASNREFSTYLKKQTTPKFFEEAIQYKFAIAERFKKGAKKHLMGWKSMPQWVPAEEEAIAIYDEVIAALPHHDLGAQALFGKGQLLLREQDFKESVESFQTLIRRFPKHPLTPEAYLGIEEVYLSQCRAEYLDADYLELAQINLRKFKQDFPHDDRTAKAEKMLLEMKEEYGGNLYETGQFFERTKKPHASVIYYSKVVNKYPETKAAAKSQKRLTALEEKLEQAKKRAKQKQKGS